MIRTHGRRPLACHREAGHKSPLIASELLTYVSTYLRS